MLLNCSVPRRCNRGVRLFQWRVILGIKVILAILSVNNVLVRHYRCCKMKVTEHKLRSSREL